MRGTGAQGGAEADAGRMALAPPGATTARPRTRARMLALGLLGGLAACGAGDGGAGTEADGAPDAPSFDAAPAADPHWSDGLAGEIRVTETTTPGLEPPTHASIRGRLSATGLPDFHIVAMSSGSCRLRSYELGQCDACSGICVAPAECRPWPTVESAGTLTVTGLQAQPTFTYDPYVGYYPTDALPVDLFAAGDAVGAAAPGDAFPAFELSAAGVATLESETIASTYLELSDAADMVIRWTAGQDPEARIRLSLPSTNQAHGLPPDAILECDIADTGELVVPKALIAAMPAFSTDPVCVAVDCPPSLLSRYRQAGVTGSAGEVQLVVESAIQFYVHHDAP